MSQRPCANVAQARAIVCLADFATALTANTIEKCECFQVTRFHVGNIPDFTYLAQSGSLSMKLTFSQNLLLIPKIPGNYSSISLSPWQTSDHSLFVVSLLGS